MADPRLCARLADMRVPVLVVWGESDRVVTPAYGRAVGEAFPHARLGIIAQCGHLPEIERPHRLLKLVASMDRARRRDIVHGAARPGARAADGAAKLQRPDERR